MKPIDNSGVEPVAPGSFDLPSPGPHLFTITDYRELVTKKGDDMLMLISEVFGDPDPAQNGLSCPLFVTFIPKGQKGAGFAVHTMHILGVPCNCEKCDPKKKMKTPFTPDINMDWLGKCFVGTVTHGKKMDGYDDKGAEKYKTVANIGLIEKTDKTAGPKKEEKKADDTPNIPF